MVYPLICQIAGNLQRSYNAPLSIAISLQWKTGTNCYIGRRLKKTHKKTYFQSKSREKKRNNELVELIFFSRSIWFCMEFSMKQKKLETLPSTDKRINSLKINTKRMNNQFNWWTHFHCNPINNLSIFVLIHVENDHHRPTYSIDYLKNDN